MRNQLYTFFLDYKGGTYVSQVRASSPLKALTAWAEALDYTKVNGLSRRARAKLAEKMNQPPTPVEGVKNTWCCSALIRGQLALIHFNETKE
jgi:hypothetical protein